MNTQSPLTVVLAAGMSTMGKTTFILRYLVANTSLACRFIFDPLGVMAAKLGLPTAETLDELEASVEDGWVCFDPGTLFPGNPKAGLEYFSAWSYKRAVALGKRTALLVDEVWKFSSAQKVPQGVAEWLHDGAKFGCQCLFTVQQPNLINGGITAELTELVCFRLQNPNALDAIAELGADADEVSRLAPGAFVSLNLFQNSTLRGRLW